MKIGDETWRLVGHKKRIALDPNDRSKGVLVKDGRPVEKIDGKWDLHSKVRGYER